MRAEAAGKRKEGDGSRDQVAGTKPKTPRKQKVVVIRRLLQKRNGEAKTLLEWIARFSFTQGRVVTLGRNGSLSPTSKPACPPASNCTRHCRNSPPLPFALQTLEEKLCTSAVCTASTIAGQQQEPHRWRRKLHPWRRRRRSTIPHCENPPSTTRPAPSSSPTPPPSRRLPPPPSRLTSRATSSQVKRPGLLS